MDIGRGQGIRLTYRPRAPFYSYGELARRIDDSAYPDELEPYKRVRLAAAAL